MKTCSSWFSFWLEKWIPVSAVFGAWLVLIVACTPVVAEDSTDVLFVGNSLTYHGNLPAVFAEFAQLQGEPVKARFIGSPGATLIDAVNDGEVAAAISSGRFDYVVLQERGADLICGFGPQVCKDSRDAHAGLVKIATSHGVAPVLLGTYQSIKGSSDALAAAESDLARTLNMTHVAVSPTLFKARQRFPERSWIDPDGVHPGKDLILLSAVLLYRQLFGHAPEPVDTSIRVRHSARASAESGADAVEVVYLPDTLNFMISRFGGSRQGS